MTHFTRLPIAALLLFPMAAVPAIAEDFQYDTPADIAETDFADDPDGLAEMQRRWTDAMTAFTDMAIAGNPWTNMNDAPRVNYLDPAEYDQTVNTAVQPITWTAFPNKVNWYFSTSQGNPYALDPALTYPLADKGNLADDAVLQTWIDAHGTTYAKTLRANLSDVLAKYPALGETPGDSFAAVSIPTGVSGVCPVVHWDQPQDQWALYSSRVGGPRGWKDEYNEWVVTRNDGGQITKISFTAENPEYWFTLWEVDPEKVLVLYQQLVGPQVVIEDLYLRDAEGNVVNDAAGNPAYNPLNKWNYGNEATETGGGAVHLTSPPNTVGAEMYLGGAATILRDLPDDQYSPANMICSGQYGGNFRNSDPNIGMQGNQVVRNVGKPITLTNPIALYMQMPDFSNYETPDGTPASEFFTVVRGRTAAEAGPDVHYDQILHATFEVPAEKGYTVSDIVISPPTNEDRVFPGMVLRTPPLPILYGSQIAETFNQALAATAYLDVDLADSTRFPPVAEKSPASAQNGWAQPLVTMAVFDAVQSQPAISAATIPLLPFETPPGVSLPHMALEVLGGAMAPVIDYVGPDGTVAQGITVTLNGAMPQTDAPAEDGIYEVILYDLSIEIGPDVPDGSYGVRVTNPGNDPDVPVPGNILVRSGQ